MTRGAGNGTRELFNAYTAQRSRRWHRSRPSLSLPISAKRSGLVPASFIPNWKALWETGALVRRPPSCEMCTIRLLQSNNGVTSTRSLHQIAAHVVHKMCRNPSTMHSLNVRQPKPLGSSQVLYSISSQGSLVIPCPGRDLRGSNAFSAWTYRPTC